MPETYPLDDAAIALFGEIRQAMNALNEQSRGALALFLRQHSLMGAWRIANNGRELESVSAVDQPAEISAIPSKDP